MKWDDTGIIISSKKHGDSSLILSVLTEEHGKHSGYIRNKVTKKNSFIYEIGNIIDLTWTGRLEDHLGYYKCELLNSYSYNFFDNSLTLNALNSFCDLQNNFLPEREVYKNLYNHGISFIKLVNSKNLDWVYNYIKWEVILLSELGYGMDLSCCAVTGNKNNLIYVSPKSGRAVSADAAGKWKSKLLNLPGFLISSELEKINKNNIIDGIKLTSFFLKKYLSNLGLKLPESRDRFVNELMKLSF